MNALTLQLRSIRSLEPLDDTAKAPQAIPSDGRYICLNSSHELEHGLDVVELNARVDCAVEPLNGIGDPCSAPKHLYATC